MKTHGSGNSQIVLVDLPEIEDDPIGPLIDLLADLLARERIREVEVLSEEDKS